MARYRNGHIPDSALITFHTGWSVNDKDFKWQLPPSTYRKHLGLVARAKKRTGRTLSPSQGWSCYRPYRVQIYARQMYGNGAATPGTSSHGGFWEGKDTAAIDYGNWGAVYGWNRDAFYADCRAEGLTPGQIHPSRNRTYPDEPWHVIDLDPWAPVPAGAIGGNVSKPKEIRVKTYNFKDKTALEKGRTVAPGDTFRLHDALDQPAANGRNIVGGVGPYSIITHVYAEGAPGDSVEVRLIRYARGESPSGHYVERGVFDRNGLVRFNPGFHLDVAKDQRVFVELTALSTNEAQVKVTRLDSDAYLYTVA